MLNLQKSVTVSRNQTGHKNHPLIELGWHTEPDVSYAINRHASRTPNAIKPVTNNARHAAAMLFLTVNLLVSYITNQFRLS